MRLRISLCTAAIFLLATWMAVTTVGVAGGDRFVLEVPATYLSVGQEFQPRVVGLGQSPSDPPASIVIELRDANGERISSQLVDLADAAPEAVIDASPVVLPRPGRYQLRARAAAGGSSSPVQTITLQATVDPSGSYGGVVSVASLGVAPGVADYLRQHGFAVREDDPVEAAVPPRLIVVGDPRFGGERVAAQYEDLWKQVGAGAGVLFLEPPAPSVARFWPLAPPLVPVSGACDDDLFPAPLADGLSPDAALATLLRPALTFDLSRQSQLDLYHWDGARLPRPNGHSGYAGCHPVFSFRYGSGWATVSTVPLLQHFQDARARIYLMNLIKAALGRKRPAPDSPGLQWVMERRWKQLDNADPLQLDAAAFYRSPPAASEPAAVLAPSVTEGDAGVCWQAPAADAQMWLDLRRPQAVRTLTLDFGPSGGGGLADFALEGSADGVHWSPLPLSAANSGGEITLPLPAAPPLWQAFRLTVVGAAPRWSLCRFTAQ